MAARCPISRAARVCGANVRDAGWEPRCYWINGELEKAERAYGEALGVSRDAAERFDLQLCIDGIHQEQLRSQR